MTDNETVVNYQQKTKVRFVINNSELGRDYQNRVEEKWVTTSEIELEVTAKFAKEIFAAVAKLVSEGEK